ncbi:MAG: phosphoribosylanthranilate isomerase [Magnetococcales bacterium]|nr:phosphoribosylanthranilate isomerase [Magnetococcales bacterium]
MRTRIKICGLTREEEVVKAVELGVDAIGLVFHPASPRHVSLERAALLAGRVPPFVSLVGLFVNASSALINEAIAACRLTVIQFHGDETPEACRGWPCRVIKAVRVAGRGDLLGLERYQVEAFLLDAKVSGAFGGTGQRFDWSLLREWTVAKPLILAGGLHAENVGEALRQVRPWAVDCSSGVEESPGRKDPLRMARFVEEVRSFDCGNGRG